MSVDLLRRAAKTLREHAEKAQHEHPWCPDYTWTAVRHVQRNCDLEVDCATHGDDRTDCWSFNMYDGRYVALMHPPVALALAQWLDITADNLEQFANELVGGEVRDGDLTDVDRAAIATARAILRKVA